MDWPGSSSLGREGSVRVRMYVFPCGDRHGYDYRELIVFI